MKLSIILISSILLMAFAPVNMGSVTYTGAFHVFMFDNLTGGKIAIESMRNNNGTMMNDAVYKNNGIYLDGTGDYITAANHSSQSAIVNLFSIAIWVKADNLTQSQRFILDKPNATNSDTQFGVLWEYVNDRYSFYSQTQSGTNPYSSGSHIAITDTKWHFLVYTYNGATFKGYLDGIEKVSFNSTFTLRTTSTNPIYIGASHVPGNYYQGYIDNMMWYSRPLTHTEIKDMFVKQYRQ